MLHNKKFNFKNVNGWSILFYCVISICLTNFCFCTSYDVHLPDFGDEKTVLVDNEEIIRRKSVAESYLREIEVDNTQNGWIETYSSFLEKEDLLENEDEIHVTPLSLYPFANVDFSSQRNSGDSINSYESILSGLDSSINPKDGSKSFKKATDNIDQHSFVTDTNDENTRQSLKNSNDQMCSSNVSNENSKSNNLETKKPRKKQVRTKSRLNKPHTSNINHEMAMENIDGNSYVYIKDNKSEFKIKHSNNINKHDFQFYKFIEIIIMNSTFISEKYFINSASLTLTEFQRLKENLAQLSFLQKNKNNVYSINRMNIIDSLGKLTPLNKQDEFIEEKPLHLYRFSNSNDEISINSIQDNVNSVKRFVTDFEKRVSYKLNNEENVTPDRVKHSSTNNKKIISSSKFSNSNDEISTKSIQNKVNTIKRSVTEFEKRVNYKLNDGENVTPDKVKYSSTNNKKIISSSYNNDFSYDSEILRRKKLMNSFLTTLNDDQKNWVDTYDFNDLISEPEENVLPPSMNDNFKERENSYNLEVTLDKPKKFSRVHLHERSYIIRWINRLHNKIKDSQCSYCSHNILISGDNLKILGKLSQEFDIVTFDELINSIISNSTMDNNIENMLYFYYENTFNTLALFINYPIVYIIITFLFAYIFLYSLFSNTGPNENFSLYRIILTLLKHYNWIIFITLLSLSFFWHGNKMFQQKIAEKHSVMSRIVPSYCESILKKESGIVAHFKEYFRSWYHDEDCKKYYEAVMVDPASEISPLSVSTDLFSEAVFQMLKPFGRNMNSFFKELTKDLSLFQEMLIPIFTFLILTVVLCFCLLFLAFRWNYKVYFPFHMGSIEPTEYSVGSRVQEVEEKESTLLKDSNTSCSVSQITYNDKTKEKSYIEDVVLKENNFLVESKHIELDPSKYYVLKVSRMRHNSI